MTADAKIKNRDPHSPWGRTIVLEKPIKKNKFNLGDRVQFKVLPAESRQNPDSLTLRGSVMGVKYVYGLDKNVVEVLWDGGATVTSLDEDDLTFS